MSKSLEMLKTTVAKSPICPLCIIWLPALTLCVCDWLPAKWPLGEFPWYRPMTFNCNYAPHFMLSNVNSVTFVIHKFPVLQWLKPAYPRKPVLEKMLHFSMKVVVQFIC